MENINEQLQTTKTISMTQQNEHFDFKNVPDWYVMCFNNNCPMRENCLRFLAGSHVPEEIEAVRCVTFSTLKDGQCRWLDAKKKAVNAIGFSRLFQNVLKKDFTPMREAITKYLHGPKAYYEYKRGERQLTPQQQQWIKNLVKSYGYDWEVPFDGKVETFVYGMRPLSAPVFYL